MTEVAMCLRERIIDHIMAMRAVDPDYARWALRQYAGQLPWLDLVDGVKITIAAEDCKIINSERK